MKGTKLKVKNMLKHTTYYGAKSGMLVPQYPGVGHENTSSVTNSIFAWIKVTTMNDKKMLQHTTFVNEKSGMLPLLGVRS